jgi:hypothetical protein
MPFPVILVSAANRLADLAGTSMADAFLNKPFNLGELGRLTGGYS